MVSDLIRSYGHVRPILPRSRHLPRASTEGSRTENLNKNGVRLWTASSLDEHREIGGGHALDPLTSS